MTKHVNGALLAAGMLVLGLLYGRYGVAPVVSALARVSPGYLLAYLAVACGVRVAYGVRWSLVACVLGDVPSLRRFVAARLAGDAVGTLVPVGRVGGDPLRVALLYRDGVGGARASAGVVIDRIMEIIGNSVAATTYVMLFAFPRTLGVGWTTVMLAVIALSVPTGALVLLLLQLRVGQRPLSKLCAAVGLGRTPRGARGLDLLRRTEDDLGRFCSQQPALLACGVVGSLLIEGVIIVEYMLLFAAFGLQMELSTLLLVLVATGVARAVPVPASLGTLEASQVAVLAATSARPDVGLVVGTVLRLQDTAWVAAGLAALSAQGLSLRRLRTVSSAGGAPV